MHISQYKPGDTVRLLSFGHCNSAYRRRLLSLGITQNVLAQVVRFAPLGCPVELKVRSTSITLRLEEADALVWELVP